MGTLVTNNTPLSEVRSLNDNNVKITDKNNTSSALDRLLYTNSTIAKMSNRTHKKAKAKPINERRRKSRAILEHLMTRARFYKMIESKMNRYNYDIINVYANHNLKYISVTECAAESVFKKLFVIHQRTLLTSITALSVTLSILFLRK